MHFDARDRGSSLYGRTFSVTTTSHDRTTTVTTTSRILATAKRETERVGAVGEKTGGCFINFIYSAQFTMVATSCMVTVELMAKGSDYYIVKVKNNTPKLLGGEQCLDIQKTIIHSLRLISVSSSIPSTVTTKFLRLMFF